MKCIVCEDKEAKLWFNLLNVCPECFDMLMKRKIEKEHRRQLQ